MPKIDLMIVGAQKAGTTALKEFLGEHPQISTHHQVEFDYFVSPEKYKSFDECFNTCYSSNSKFVVAKNASLYHNENGIKRLYEHNPKCKLVFIVREPISRALSSYNMAKFSGWFKGDYEDFMNVIDNNIYNDSIYRVFLNLGLYDKHYQIITKYFNKKNVFIYLYDNFKEAPLTICSDIFKQNDLDSSFRPQVNKKHNVTRMQKSKIIGILIGQLQKDNNLLKRAIKKLIPYKYFTFFGDSLIKFNKSKTVAPDFPEYLNNYLKEYYKKSISSFEEAAGLSLKKWK